MINSIIDHEKRHENNKAPDDRQVMLIEKTLEQLVVAEVAKGTNLCNANFNTIANKNYNRPINFINEWRDEEL